VGGDAGVQYCHHDVGQRIVDLGHGLLGTHHDVAVLGPGAGGDPGLDSEGGRLDRRLSLQEPGGCAGVGAAVGVDRDDLGALGRRDEGVDGHAAAGDERGQLLLLGGGEVGPEDGRDVGHLGGDGTFREGRGDRRHADDEPRRTGNQSPCSIPHTSFLGRAAPVPDPPNGRIR
jgi:hypothetical protein